MNEKENEESDKDSVHDDVLFDESTDGIIHYNDHEHGDIGEGVALLRAMVTEMIRKPVVRRRQG
jgi:hypothetical protein